jgi:hypothetical protein
MTAQEQQMLQGLADRVNGTQLPDKDVDAERMIQQTLGPNPDAMYVMAQTILVQQYALDQARQQMAALGAPLDTARTGSFLGNLLGHHEEPQRPAAAPPPPPMPVPQAPAQYQQAPMYAPSGGYPLPGEPQGGGFLRSAMQTATGVAAGALAFEGIESLMHGFGHTAGYGPAFGTTAFEGVGGGRPEEVVNNYYGDSAQHEHGADAATTTADKPFTDIPTDPSQVKDVSDVDNSGTLQDASFNTHDGSDLTADPSSGSLGDDGVDYSGNQDDSELSDDVSQDDSGGFDNSGGDVDDSGDFDSGGGDSSDF